MTGRDLFVISTGNLLRMKLRTFLTTSGVLIAIAAFVAMLSFAAGNQKYVEEEYLRFGLFTTIQVSPRGGSEAGDSSRGPRLDRAALDRLAAIPGVNLVYPYEAFTVRVKLGDTVLASKAQALPATALRTRFFATLTSGRPFGSDSSRQVLVSDELMKKAGRPDSALGFQAVVSVRVSTPDSGLAHVLMNRGESIIDRLRRIRTDSLGNRGYRSRTIRSEIHAAMQRFMEGFLQAQETLTDTLTVCGVYHVNRSGRLRTEEMIIPLVTAARFNNAGMSGSPSEMMASLSTGSPFGESRDASGKTFSLVTISFDPGVLSTTIRDSVEALGFRAFSFAAQFEQIQRFFLAFDMAIGVIGLIALVTVSLGIVNTMVMSITERRKEIGVLRALGANDLDIRALFIVESGAIGLLGTSLGIFCGWALTRIVSMVARGYMKGQGLPEIELFALPVWLILIALGIGIGVSVLAGIYPAGRAARVDPVEALRNE